MIVFDLFRFFYMFLKEKNYVFKQVHVLSLDFDSNKFLDDFNLCFTKEKDCSTQFLNCFERISCF